MVEKAKIASSYNDPVSWNANFFKKAFSYTLNWNRFRQVTIMQIEKIRNALRESLRWAQVHSDDIWKILLVWWTWQLRIIREMLEEEIGNWKIIQWDTFNAIGKWLSI